MTAEFVPEHCSKLTKNACFNHYFYEITVLGDPLSKSGKSHDTIITDFCNYLHFNILYSIFVE